METEPSAAVTLPGIMLVHTAPEGEALLPVGLLVLFALGGVLLPTLLGYATALPMARAVGREREGRLPVLASGLATGVLLFLFIDFMLLTAFLGMGGGLGWRQPALVGLFLVPLVLAAAAPAFAARLDPSRPPTPVYPPVLVVWAAGIGLHSFSEGLIMGHNLTLGLGVALRVLPVTSFVVHKFGEGFTGAALFLGRAEPTAGRIAALVALASLPAIPGVLLGYAGLSGAVAAYFYAAAAGVLVYVLPHVWPVAQGTRRSLWYAGAAAGFLVMYLSGVLHEL